MIGHVHARGVMGTGTHKMCLGDWPLRGEGDIRMFFTNAGSVNLKL